MEIQRYVDILERRKWLAVLTAIVTVAVVGLGSYQMTPVYSASTIVRIAQIQDRSIDYFDLNYSVRLMNTYAHVLRSRPLLEEVIQRLDLNTWSGDLANRVGVEVLADTELLKITAESTNPRQAMAIANTLATLLIEQGQKVYAGQGKSAREILQEQLAVVEEKLREDRALLESLLNDSTGQDQPGAIEDLNTRIRIQEQTYAMLLDEYEDARVGEAIRANSISVVEPAVAPNAPSKPRMKLNIALGGLVGLVGGIGLAFLFENLDPAIHSVDDLEAAAEVPLLGSIPRFTIPRRSPQGTTPLDDDGRPPAGKAFRILRSNILEAVVETPLLGWIPRFTIPRKSRQEAIFLDGDGQSPAGEAFRILRSSVLSPASGRPPKTLLITSAERGAGKSTVLANLAVVMAQAGRKVVVVDSDFRHPCLHQVFDLPNRVGLSNVISDLSRADAALRDTRIQGVRALPSGPLPPYPAELLGLSKMQEVIEELAKEADMVLLDSPPILAVADAAILAPMVDGVLLVAARGQVTEKRVQRTLQQLHRLGARTLGIVFNKGKADDRDYY